MSSTPPPLQKRNPYPLWMKVLIGLGVFGFLVFFVGPIALVLTNLSRSYYMPTGSMSPAIKPGDYVATEGFSYLRGSPRRGDILVFKTDAIPGVGHQTYIKRLIGFPGEELRIDRNSVYVNGERISFRNKEGEIVYVSLNYGNPPTPSIFTPKYLRTPQETYKVPADSYFVLGDNTWHSADSRMWGGIPASSVLGRAAWCYWPPSHVGSIE